MSAADHPDQARIGVIGGSGLYRLLEDATQVEVGTPYGSPSSPLAVGLLNGERVAFLARHGTGHTIPPQRVNYRANLWALASRGVVAIIGSSAVGSLSPAMPSESFVVPDQLIDRTRDRIDTFYDGPDVQHLAFADPFDPGIRRLLIDALTSRSERFAPTGTTVVISGPRFSTRAESKGWRSLGADIVNMTQYPEAALAAELNLGYASLSFVTDTDTGHYVGDEPVTADVVFRRLSAARKRITGVIGDAVAAVPTGYAPRDLIDPDAVARVMARDRSSP
ncbi:S-methyl-5'-thioadenosine phosphorylase [Microbacterium sp. NPDC019599]|uniref:S-methyl-5'-thioadenosine phosphorylase n=1 Tax=Microbacterium sp. NPDC019599 TaxID=3154690 RepID=UPI0034064850